MRLTPGERIVGWRLTEGRRVTPAEMIVALYGHLSDGGPLWAESGVRKHVYNLRAHLAPYGIVIRNDHVFGYSVMPDQIERLRTVLADEIADNVKSPRKIRSAAACVTQFSIGISSSAASSRLQGGR